MDRTRIRWTALALLLIPAMFLLYKLFLNDQTARNTTGLRPDSGESSRQDLSIGPTPPNPSSPLSDSRKSSSDPDPDNTTEEALMEAARSLLFHKPDQALKHIELADRLYGEHNADRRVLEIEVQVRLGQVGHARSLADRFYRTFPESPEITHIERLTGYHPRPYGP